MRIKVLWQCTPENYLLCHISVWKQLAEKMNIFVYHIQSTKMIMQSKIHNYYVISLQDSFYDCFVCHKLAPSVFRTCPDFIIGIIEIKIVQPTSHSQLGLEPMGLRHVLFHKLCFLCDGVPHSIHFTQSIKQCSLQWISHDQDILVFQFPGERAQDFIFIQVYIGKLKVQTSGFVGKAASMCMI